MSPNEVNSHNEQHLLDTVYNYKREMKSSTIKPIIKAAKASPRRRAAQFKVGDHVRISKYRYTFDKGYTPNWTTEIFRIRKVQYHTDPITYLLKDYQDEVIKGSFYVEELQKVKHPDVYLYEKIIDREKGKVLVKWLGFGPEHNSWIREKDIL